MTELPEPGDVVVCKIAKVLDYGVFVDMPEFEGIQGFVHISQVSSSWVKNIRNFVKEGQMRAAKVVHIDRSKGQIDLSFNKVTPRLQRTKINDWKQFKRSQKLIEVLAKEKNIDAETAWSEIAEPLLENYESLVEAFQQILVQGEPAAKGVPQKWVKPLMEMVKKNIEVPQKTIKGTLAISTMEPDGVELIKKALISGRGLAKGAEVQILYTGSGKYVLTSTSHDYVTAERAVKMLVDSVTASMKGKGDVGFGKKEAS